MSTNDEMYSPLDLDYETDEILLVQATGFDNWFIDTLDALKIDWESIPNTPRWIQFEIPSQKLQWLIHTYSDVTLDILE
jgi:hypothetical protein